MVASIDVQIQGPTHEGALALALFLSYPVIVFCHCSLSFSIIIFCHCFLSFLVIYFGHCFLAFLVIVSCRGMRHQYVLLLLCHAQSH